MGKPLKLRKIGKDRLVYYLPSLKLLNEKFIDKVNWPEDKELLIFRIAKKNIIKGKPIEDMVSLKKYVCRTSYVFNKSGLPKGGADGGRYGLKLAPFKNLAEYEDVSRKTTDKYFIKPFKDYINSAYTAEYENYIKNSLPKTKGISITRDGERVAMLSLLKTNTKKPFSPLHWITWIWVDGSQPKEVRQVIHAMLRGWVRRNSLKYVGGAAHAANLKSQYWFIKSGGHPIQIFFSRR